MDRKETFKLALESQNIPSDLAEQCAAILINDDFRPRTKEEQETIDKAWKIAFKVDINHDPKTTTIPASIRAFWNTLGNCLKGY